MGKAFFFCAALLLICGCAPSTPSQAEQIKSILHKFYTISEWQDALPFILDADEVRPYMEKRFQIWPISHKPVSVDIDLPDEPTDVPIGGEVRALVTTDNGESLHERTVFLKRTDDGFKVDWLKTNRILLLSLQVVTEGTLAKADAARVVSFRELKTSGDKYAGSSVRLLGCEFKSVDKSVVLPEFLRVDLRDWTDEFHEVMFKPRQFADVLNGLRRDDLVNIRADVKRYRDDVILIATHLEPLSMDTGAPVKLAD